VLEIPNEHWQATAAIRTLVFAAAKRRPVGALLLESMNAPRTDRTSP
jgi:hypothetical protein